LATASGRGLFGAALLLLLSSCQLLFGDFELDESRPAPSFGPLGTGCEPNTFRCVGERLETCAPDRTSYELVESCSSAALCDPTAAACRPCTPGEWACNGATPASCDSAGQWVPGVSCASAALCRVSPARTSAACIAPSCDYPGAHDCRGDLLLRCAEGLDRLVLADRCTSAATCDPALADAQAATSGWGTCVESLPEACESDGSCTQPSCEATGAVRCVAEDLTLLEACGNAGRWTTRAACDAAALCSEDAARCLEPACSVGETRCLGQVHQTCSSDRTRWVSDRTCASNQLCVPTGCAPATCTSDTFRCNGPSLERCADNRWVAMNRCATAALCSVTGACLEPMCGGELGDFRCRGSSLEQCAAGRDAWTDFRYCAGGCRIEGGVPICDD
jgi:hypothetical protein